MITEEQFYKVQAILDGRNPNKVALAHRIRDKVDFPLRRIARCGKCGASMTGYWSQGRTKKYAYYRCSKFCTGQAVKVEILEEELLAHLKSITPTSEARELFLTFIQTTYYKRLGRLQKLRNEADGEIAKLYELRKQLVQKNLSGVFSDDIFKEQNAIIEDKIFKAQVAKLDDTFEKYDIKKLLDFMKTLLADLGEAYNQSDLNQKKALLGAIFPSGIVWRYPGTSHQEIRALFSSIRTPQVLAIPLGDPTGIRIPVTRMRTWCPRPLDDGAKMS